MVYEIGLYVMDGFGPSQIARKLRERKILTPAAYYESKGIPCNVKKQGDPYGWDNTTTQAAILREEIEEVEGKSANVDRFLSVARQYTDIPELTPRILHEFVEKIVIHAATDPHSKINRRQEVDIYYKGIGILEMSKVFDSRQK